MCPSEFMNVDVPRQHEDSSTPHLFFPGRDNSTKVDGCYQVDSGGRRDNGKGASSIVWILRYNTNACKKLQF